MVWLYEDMKDVPPRNTGGRIDGLLRPGGTVSSRFLPVLIVLGAPLGTSARAQGLTEEEPFVAQLRKLDATSPKLDRLAALR
jgi:hypothetical protein